MSLLGKRDPHPVRVSNPEGGSPFVLVSDHAGRRRPAALGDLGVGLADWNRHVAYDIGIKGVGATLARLLDAPLVEQRYSRLVIDCNRPPGHPGSVPPVSEATAVPANRALDLAHIRARECEILHPYHAAIASLLARRRDAGRRTVLVALHSFTPVYDGVGRPWHAAILHGEGEGGGERSAYARRVLATMQSEPDLVIGDNEPYSLTALSDYTVPLHAWQHGLDHVELEIRQDLISKRRGQAEWAARFASWLASVEQGAADRGRSSS